MRKSKLFLFAVSIMMLLIFGAGCATGNNTPPPAPPTTENPPTTNNPPATGEKVTIDFWTFWGSETRRPIIEKIISDFNSSQDRIEVKHTFLPWGDIWTKNLASISAGNPADVIINDINAVPHRALNGQVTEITEWARADNLEERFYPEIWKTVVSDDKIYALPFVTDTRMLFYNKDAFQEVGLDPEKPPTTWKELEEYAIKLDTKSGNNYTRIGFYPLWGNYGADSWMANADKGQDYFDEDGKPIVNTPAKVEALRWMKTWTDRLGQNNVNAYQAEFGSQQANPFLSGKVAMIVDVATFYTQIRDYGQGMNFGVAPIPEKESGNGHWSVGGGFVAEIPAKSDNPKEAYEFLKYLTDVQAQTYWAVKNFDNVANIEANEAAVNEPSLTPEGKAVYQAAVDNLETTILTPVPPKGSDFKNIITPHIDAVIIRGADPQAELDKAQRSMEAVMR